MLSKYCSYQIVIVITIDMEFFEVV